MLRKIAAALALVAGSASAQVDFQGGYTADGTNYLVITQRGALAVVISGTFMAPGAPAGAVNKFGYGIGVVSGNTLMVDAYYGAEMYCVSRVNYTLSPDGAITSTVISSVPTARGTSVGINTCESVGTTRVRVF